MVKDVVSNLGIFAVEGELVTLYVTRFLSQSPKRCFEELSGGFWLLKKFRKETILPERDS